MAAGAKPLLEMTATNHHRCDQFPIAHHFVKSQPCFLAISKSDPTIPESRSGGAPCRARYVGPRCPETAVSSWHRFCRYPRDHRTVPPSETGRCHGRTEIEYRRAQSQENQAHIQPLFQCHLAGIGAVIHGCNAHRVKLALGLDLQGHRGPGYFLHCFGVGFTFVVPLSNAPTLR